MKLQLASCNHSCHWKNRFDSYRTWKYGVSDWLIRATIKVKRRPLYLISFCPPDLYLPCGQPIQRSPQKALTNRPSRLIPRGLDRAACLLYLCVNNLIHSLYVAAIKDSVSWRNDTFEKDR